MHESEIIKQVLLGQRESFGVLVERYQEMVFRTCMGFLHNKEDADDLTQEIFIQVYQSLSNFKGESSFSTWIYRIAVNASLNRVRKTSKNFLIQRIESLWGTDKQKPIEISAPESENPENLMIRDEYRVWVQRALNSLPENQRIAIILSKYDDLSQREIAEIMNTTEGAVEALIQRAKANLRERLASFSKKVKNNRRKK
jgi:RNA polymerase sigma-70 factor, ECF subfamily